LLDDITRFLLAIALGDTGRVLSVDEPILLHRTDRNLDNLVAITTDDRFLGKDIPDVIAD
jgi:hypothetical protein